MHEASILPWLSTADGMCIVFDTNFSISTYPTDKIDEINSLDQNLNL